MPCTTARSLTKKSQLQMCAEKYLEVCAAKLCSAKNMPAQIPHSGSHTEPQCGVHLLPLLPRRRWHCSPLIACPWELMSSRTSSKLNRQVTSGLACRNGLKNNPPPHRTPLHRPPQLHDLQEERRKRENEKATHQFHKARNEINVIIFRLLLPF